MRFYRDLLLPWGGLPLGGPLQLTMALPQMLASVIGLSPYALDDPLPVHVDHDRPIVIAAIEGGALALRYRSGGWIVLPWLAVCMYVSNVAWSPSPLSPQNYDMAWAVPAPATSHPPGDEDVPDYASVTATYGILPHLSHREQIYDWPNPWVMAYFGNDDRYRLPDPSDDRVHHPRPPQRGRRRTTVGRLDDRAGRRVRGAVQPGRHPRRQTTRAKRRGSRRTAADRDQVLAERGRFTTCSRARPIGTSTRS